MAIDPRFVGERTPRAPRARSVVLRGSLAAALAGILAAAVFSLGASARADEPPAPPTEQEVAAARGLTLEQLRRLTDQRGMSLAAVLAIHDVRLRRALWRLEHLRPDHPGEAIQFRARQQQDARGRIDSQALGTATKHLKALRAKGLVKGVKAGVPIGRKVGESPLLKKSKQALTGEWIWLGPGNIGGRVRSLVIHPRDPNIMLAASSGGGVWKTVDAGGSWHPLTDFLASLVVTSLVMDPRNPDTIYAATGEGFYNLDGFPGAGVFVSHDGGDSWSQLESTANADFAFVNRLAVSSNGRVLLAATRAGVMRSTDAGASWALTTTRGSDTLDIDFQPGDDSRAVASGWFGRVHYSTDGGQSWTDAVGLPTIEPSGIAGRVEIAHAAATPTVVYASVDNQGGEIYRSSDGGKNFTLMNTGSRYFLHQGAEDAGQGWYDNIIWAGDPTNADFVLVGGINLWRSADGGRNLTEISQWQHAPLSAHADNHAIVAHPKYNGTSNRVVFFGNDGGVYRAGDATRVFGATGWQELNNSLGITQFYGAAGHPDTGVVIGGAQDNGSLMYHPDAGPENWRVWVGGDGGYCAIDPTDANCFYGEYVGLTIYRSLDGGRTANNIYEGIGDAGDGARANFIAPFILDPNAPRTLLAGGRKLWRSTDAKAATPTWTAIKPDAGDTPAFNISAIAVAPGEPNVIWVGHNNGMVFKTDDGAAAEPTWRQVGAGQLPADIWCARVAADPRNPRVAYALFGSYGRASVWKTSDGGDRWINLHGVLPAAPARTLAIHPANSNWLYLGTEVGLFVSSDGGVNWDPTNQGPANCCVDELFWMGEVLTAATHGRGVFQIRIPRGG